MTIRPEILLAHVFPEMRQHNSKRDTIFQGFVGDRKTLDQGFVAFGSAT
jgi:hypothetical protein